MNPYNISLAEMINVLESEALPTMSSWCVNSWNFEIARHLGLHPEYSQAREADTAAVLVKHKTRKNYMISCPNYMLDPKRAATLLREYYESF